MPSLKTQEIGEVLIIDFTESRILDEALIAQIGQELMSAALSASQKNKKLLVNFQNVKFMSSAMIGKLVLLNKKCKADEVALRMSNISSNLMEVFKITNLNKMFEIHDNEEKAIKSFTKKTGFFG